MPFGFHGVFAALTGGVVFGLQGFEQAVQLAGEARNPKRDLSRAILTAMAIGAVLYTLLQIVMIGGARSGEHREGWTKPLGDDAVRLRRLVHARARARRRLAREGAAHRRHHLARRHGRRLRRRPRRVSRTRSARSARCRARSRRPTRRACRSSRSSSAALVGCSRSGRSRAGRRSSTWSPAPPRSCMRSRRCRSRRCTSSTARRAARTACRSPKVLLPAAFCSANLIIYWGGFDATWKLRARCSSGSCCSRFGACAPAPARRATFATPCGSRRGSPATWPRRPRSLRRRLELLPTGSIALARIVFSLATLYLALGLTLTAKASTRRRRSPSDAHQLEFDASAP